MDFMLELAKIVLPGFWVVAGAWLGSKFAYKNTQAQLVAQTKSQLDSRNREETSRKLQEIHALAIDRNQRLKRMLQARWTDHEGVPLIDEWQAEFRAIDVLFDAADRAAHYVGFWLSSTGDTHRLLAEIDKDLRRYQQLVRKQNFHYLEEEDEAEADALQLKISLSILNLEVHFQKLLNIEPAHRKMTDEEDLRIDAATYRETRQLLRRMSETSADRPEPKDD